MGILDKIADIEREIARTQKNKGTLYNIINFNMLFLWTTLYTCIYKIELSCKAHFHLFFTIVGSITISKIILKCYIIYICLNRVRALLYSRFENTTIFCILFINNQTLWVIYCQRLDKSFYWCTRTKYVFV